MASSSAATEQTPILKDTTITVVDSNTKPMEMDSTTVISSTETKAADGTTENTVTTKGSSDGSDNNCNMELVEAKRVPRCIGRSNKGVSWGYSLEQGRRSKMEDVVAVYPGFMKLRCQDVGGCTAPECIYSMEKLPVHFFGLFDGHGGDKVSTYCATELCQLVADEWERGSTLDGWSKRWEVALCKAYERADSAFKDETIASKFCGSTALVLIISACQIIAANCGDSRAVLCRGTEAIPLTVDHKLDRKDESDRIKRSGGRILNWGCLRVEGVLSMSRAIGNLDLKQWVIPVPEITFKTRTEQDGCLILASDGLWDVLSNEEVVKLARNELRQRRRLVGDNPFPPAWYVSEQVLKQALCAYSCDNISVIVVDLKNPRIRPKTALKGM